MVAYVLTVYAINSIVKEGNVFKSLMVIHIKKHVNLHPVRSVEDVDEVIDFMKLIGTSRVKCDKCVNASVTARTRTVLNKTTDDGSNLIVVEQEVTIERPISDVVRILYIGYVRDDVDAVKGIILRVIRWSNGTAHLGGLMLYEPKAQRSSEAFGYR